jgi:hypothetical protein
MFSLGLPEDGTGHLALQIPIVIPPAACCKLQHDIQSMNGSLAVRCVKDDVAFIWPEYGE